MPTRQDTGIWTPELKRFYQKFPTIIRTSYWSQIIKLVNLGKIDDATAIAQEHEGSEKTVRAQNVIARRLRLQRIALFALQKQTTTRIKAAFSVSADALVNIASRTAPVKANIARMKKGNRAVIVDLRRALLSITTDAIWGAIVLGVKDMGEAIKPILRDNRESFEQELKEIAIVEEKLTFDMHQGFANRAKGSVVMGSDKWTEILDKLYEKIARASSDDGMTLSDRIWDLTNRMEMDLRRALASEIAQGSSASDIAKEIEDYVNSGSDDIQSGPGIYSSPLKNALRVARTETSRAYAQASAVWAQDKEWVKGMMVTLSPAHDTEDECDDLAGDIYSPEEFPDIIPAHPHCMCFGVYVIDDSKLGDAGSTDAGGDQTDDSGEED